MRLGNIDNWSVQGVVEQEQQVVVGEEDDD